MVAFTTLILSGCSVSKPVETIHLVKLDFSKYSNLQLCQIQKKFEVEKLSVNPSSHPEYQDDYKYYQLLSKEVDSRNDKKVVAYCDKLIADNAWSNMTTEQKADYQKYQKEKAQKQCYYADINCER